MAGAGYKLFNTGDVLTAAQVNTYLMEQSVMVFADAAARTTALTGVVAEGMLSYLKDTNAVEVYNGSAWVASDDPNAIQNTIVDAKGDLISASGADVPARLAVGNNGETLVADSSASTGLRWQSAYNGNGIINGGMDIWQRGTSFALTSPSVAYTADRWLGRHLGTNVTYSQQASGLTGIQYGLRIQRPNGTTGTNDQQIYYQFETPDSYRYAGQTVTLSFYAKAGANFSATSSLMTSAIYSGTGTNQNITSGAYTGQATVVTQNNTLTTSYQRFSVTGTVAASATQIAIIFSATPTGTAGANDWYEITGVQLEVGSVATSFKRSGSGGGTLAGELAACQRYYATSLGNGNAGIWDSSTEVWFGCRHPVSMRTTPSVTLLVTALSGRYNGNVTSTSSTISYSELDANGASVKIGGWTGGLTNAICILRTNNAAAFSAEL